jgi:predicted Fe-Mo cluster-binding NifX family protein
MKIVITARGGTLESEVDPRFGRAAYFMVHDTESGAWEAVDNAQNLQAPKGAGIQAGETVARLGAEAVLTGHCGPKAFRTLSAADIAIYTGAEGTVASAVEDFLAGRLTSASGADVEGHGF